MPVAVLYAWGFSLALASVLVAVAGWVVTGAALVAYVSAGLALMLAFAPGSFHLVTHRTQAAFPDTMARSEVQRAAIAALLGCPPVVDAWVADVLDPRAVIGVGAAHRELARRQAFAFAVAQMCSTRPEGHLALMRLRVAGGTGDRVENVITAGLRERSHLTQRAARTVQVRASTGV